RRLTAATVRPGGGAAGRRCARAAVRPGGGSQPAAGPAARRSDRPTGPEREETPSQEGVSS
ncbi:hypothetical protein ACWGOE_14235, partial [Leucobacter chromiiresistens]